VKVLVAEDEPVSRHRLLTALRKWGYTVTEAIDGAEALRALHAGDGPRLAILDRLMPQVDGLEVCREIRKTAREPYVYLILLTSRGGQQEIIDGFEAGADDYMTKPFDVQELKARVRTGARIVELQEELIAAREQLRAEAMHDSLTGLFNRAAFFEIFDKEAARSRRDGTPLALIMADLDHFKETNDRYGHIAGDAVLRETARRLRVSLRASDVIGRYGGEEFVIVAPNCGLTDAVALAERFRACVSAQSVEVSNADISITMSFGVAGTAGPDGFQELLRTADEALYRAKHSGRNRVETGPPC
jgi:two-component system cell cycle response regulator